MANKPVFIYIVGRGHSGSTLLELLLNRSENIAAMGEIDMLGLQIYRNGYTRWVGKCSCQKRPDECLIWQQVLAKVKQNFGADLIKAPFSWRISDVGTEEEYGIGRLFSWIWYKWHRIIRSWAYRGSGSNAGPYTNMYRQWIKNRDEVAKAYAAAQNVDAVVDASKDPLQMRDIVAHSDLDVKVLFLVRDVRGLAWSAIKKRRSDAKTEARDWAKLNARVKRLLDGIDKNKWLLVKYEDICAQPDAELAKIHDFIGIERKELTVEEEQNHRHTIAGNRTRFRPIKSVIEDNEWTENLSQEQLNEVIQIAGDVARDLGYDL